VLESAVAHGMFFMPGSVFFADVDDDRSLRLSISNHTPESIAQGMSRLESAIAAVPVGAT
jgi:DNA-binding transcriptional MocR family regulator